MARPSVKYGLSLVGLFAAVSGLLVFLLLENDESADIMWQHLLRSQRGANDKVEGLCTFDENGCRAVKLVNCTSGSCDGIGIIHVPCTSENCPAIWSEWVVRKAKHNDSICNHFRERNCTNIKNVPDNCDKYQTKSIICNTSLWSTWENWQCIQSNYSCTARRSRMCYIGVDNSDCNGTSFEDATCTASRCFGQQGSFWSEWTDHKCFFEQDGCFNIRNRTCSSGVNENCHGKHYHISMDCSTECYGNWTIWSGWQCKKGVGSYTAHRSRNCSAQPPKTCKGSPNEVYACGPTPCPVCTEFVTSNVTQGPTIATNWTAWECFNSNNIVYRIRYDSRCSGSECQEKENNEIDWCNVAKCPDCYNGSKPIAKPTDTSFLDPVTDIVTTQNPWDHWKCKNDSGLMFRVEHKDCTDPSCLGENHALKPCNETECPECFGQGGDQCYDEIGTTCTRFALLTNICQEPEFASKCRQTCRLCGEGTTTDTLSFLTTKPSLTTAEALTSQTSTKSTTRIAEPVSSTHSEEIHSTATTTLSSVASTNRSFVSTVTTVNKSTTKGTEEMTSSTISTGQTSVPSTIPTQTKITSISTTAPSVYPVTTGDYTGRDDCFDDPDTACDAFGGLFCQDPNTARTKCRKTCGLCGCTDEPNFPCNAFGGLYCNDPDTAIAKCRKTCNLCDSALLTPIPSISQPSSQTTTPTTSDATVTTEGGNKMSTAPPTYTSTNLHLKTELNTLSTGFDATKPATASIDSTDNAKFTDMTTTDSSKSMTSIYLATVTSNQGNVHSSTTNHISTIAPSLSTTNMISTGSEQCFDKSGSTCLIPQFTQDICKDAVASQLCRKSCKLCDSTSSASSPNTMITQSVTSAATEGSNNFPTIPPSYSTTNTPLSSGSTRNTIVQETSKPTTQIDSKFTGTELITPHSTKDTSLKHVTTVPITQGNVRSSTTDVFTSAASSMSSTKIVSTGSDQCFDKSGSTCLIPEFTQGICEDPVASELCRKTCKLCDPTSSSPNPIVAGTQTSSKAVVSSERTGILSTVPQVYVSTNSPSTTKLQTKISTVSETTRQGTTLIDSALNATFSRRTTIDTLKDRTTHSKTPVPTNQQSTTDVGTAGSGQCFDKSGSTCLIPTLQHHICADPVTSILCRKTCMLCEDFSTLTTQPTIIQNASILPGISTVTSDQLSNQKGTTTKDPSAESTTNLSTTSLSGNITSTMSTIMASSNVISTSPPSVVSSTKSLNPSRTTKNVPGPNTPSSVTSTSSLNVDVTNIAHGSNITSSTTFKTSPTLFSTTSVGGTTPDKTTVIVTSETTSDTTKLATQAPTTTSQTGHTIAPIPTKCAVCFGPPELCDELYDIQSCQAPDNYCINHIKNFDDGTRRIERGCGNHTRCYREWFQGSSDNDKCQNFVEDNVVTLEFECTYCCIKDECNVRMYPELSTLYKDV